MNFEKIKGQYLLLDTNVVINFGRYHKFYAPLIEQVVAHEIHLVINQVVRAELLAYAKNEEGKQNTLELIKRILRGDDAAVMPFTQELFNFAIQLAEKYRQAGITVGQIELPDLLIGGDMIRFNKGGKLFLATENHKDFPVPVFERLGVEVIDCNDAIGVHTIGFYRLSNDLSSVSSGSH